MNLWQTYLLAALAAGFLLLMLYEAIRRHRIGNEREVHRRLDALLKPKEEIQVTCSGRKGCWILTNKRLILQSGEGFTAFPFAGIQKVTGEDETGKTTVAAGKMEKLIVKTPDRDFILPKGDENFRELVKGLKTSVAGAKKKNKPKK